MDVQETNRGFEIIYFKDRMGKDCALQQSSVIGDYDDAFERPGSSAVWLGLTENRMELDRELAGEIIQHLRNWLETGHFEGKPWKEYMADNCPQADGEYEVKIQILNITETDQGFKEGDVKTWLTVRSYWDETDGFIHDTFGIRVTHWREV